MSGPQIAPAWARALLRLHPTWFRERWGAEVQATLLHTLAMERGRGGWAGRLSPVRAAFDLARSAVRVRARGFPPVPAGPRVPGGWGSGLVVGPVMIAPLYS